MTRLVTITFKDVDGIPHNARVMFNGAPLLGVVKDDSLLLVHGVRPLILLIQLQQSLLHVSPESFRNVHLLFTV